MKLKIALSATAFIAGSAYASIDTAPSCSVDNSTATISVTVDNSSTLSASSAVLSSITPQLRDHTRYLTVIERFQSTVQHASNLSAVQITVTDGGTTHQ